MPAIPASRKTGATDIWMMPAIALTLVSAIMASIRGPHRSASTGGTVLACIRLLAVNSKPLFCALATLVACEAGDQPRNQAAKLPEPSGPPVVQQLDQLNDQSGGNSQ